MNNSLFTEFEPISAKQWKQKIQFGLDGEDYNKVMIWKSPEGIDVKPFYDAEDLTENLRPRRPDDNNWTICQKFYVKEEASANSRALEAVDKGAESLFFVLPKEDTDIAALMDNIPCSSINIYFELQFISSAFNLLIEKYFSGKQARIFIMNDIIGHLARRGNWYISKEADHQQLKTILNDQKAVESNLSVDVSLYHNAGATAIQELAYAMGHVNEYLNFIDSEKANVPGIRSIVFKVATGSNYFFEIAKLRALRILFDSLKKEYGFEINCHIIAFPSKRNKTLYDYNVNMLRTTTECMSAVIGGADSVCNIAYDFFYHRDNEFGERIARNQLLLLKHESYFDKVENPAEGSYYIETLTRQLAEKAVELLKLIESGDGFLAQLKAHNIQRKISDSAHTEEQAFNEKNRVLVGTNKYQNDYEKMSHETEINPFVKTNPRKTLIQPIIERRLSERLEQQRIKEEKSV